MVAAVWTSAESWWCRVVIGSVTVSWASEALTPQGLAPRCHWQSGCRCAWDQWEVQAPDRPYLIIKCRVVFRWLACF